MLHSLSQKCQISVIILQSSQVMLNFMIIQLKLS